MRTLVRPAGARTRQYCGKVAGGEADQRIVLVEARDHHLAHLARRDRVAGAGAHDLEQQPFLQDHARRDLAARQQRLVGDQAEVGAAVHLRDRDADVLQRGAQHRRQVFRPDLRLFQRRDIGLELVRLLDDQLQERRRADVAGDAHPLDRRDLHLGLAGARRHHRAAERDRAGFEHRARRREVIGVAVEDDVALAEPSGVEAARGAPPVGARPFGVVDRAGRDEELRGGCGVQAAERRQSLL
jgi:hypothetical protein